MPKRILIADMTNLFISCFVSSPALNSSGEPFGGTSCTLRTISKQIRLFKPDMIIAVFDGPGGSTKRKQIFKEYKAHRSPIRLNRMYETGTDQQQNQQYQLKRLIEYFDTLPIFCVSISGVEADDIVAYYAQHPKFADDVKIISSNDKDFLQLCNKNTLVYRPMKERLMNVNDVIAEYGVSPNNMAITRALIGDSSDCIPGVPGVGLKTIGKFLPVLTEAREDVTIAQVVEFCQEKANSGNKQKFFGNVAENREIIERNYRLMQLYSPMISVQDIGRLNLALEGFVPEWSQTKFTMMLLSDGIANFNWDEIRLWSNRVTANFKGET